MNPKMKKKEPVLSVLLIEHGMGLEVYPCDSDKTAKAQLQKYVAQWWDKEMGPVPLPHDRDAAVKMYFKVQAAKPLPAVGETWRIVEAPVVTAETLRTSLAKKAKPGPRPGTKTKNALPAKITASWASNGNGE